MMNFAKCSWVNLFHAGWTPRVLGRNGAEALIRFTSPSGETEERTVPVDRLGKNLRDTLERISPVRLRVARVSVRVR